MRIVIIASILAASGLGGAIAVLVVPHLPFGEVHALWAQLARFAVLLPITVLAAVLSPTAAARPAVRASPVALETSVPDAMDSEGDHRDERRVAMVMRLKPTSVPSAGAFHDPERAHLSRRRKRIHCCPSEPTLTPSSS